MWFFQNENQGFVALPKSVSQTRIASNRDVFDLELSPEEIHELDDLDECKDIITCFFV